MKLHEQIIASGTGGVLVALIATPFDVIKTRLMSQTLHTHDRECFYEFCEGVLKDVCVSCGYEHPPQMVYRGVCQHSRDMFTGSVDAALRISRKEGVWALWNGLSPTLLMIAPSAVAYFTMYDYFRKNGRLYFSKKYHDFVPSLAGVAARCINVGLFSPVELVRTKAQSEQKLDYSKLRNSMKAHIAQNGARSLWSGAKSQLFRDVPFTVVYWYIQDKVKVRLQNQGYSTVPSNIGGALVGATAASLISHPFDLTKTRYQSSIGLDSSAMEGGLIRVFSKIVQSEGVKGLFVGLGPRMVKLLPSCAVMISTFEGLKEYFENTKVY